MISLKILLVLIACLLVGFFSMEITYRILSSRVEQRAVDKVRCFKALLATLFMVFVGIFTLYPDWLSFFISNPDARDAFCVYSGAFMKLLTIGSFLVGGISLIFTISLFIRYHQEYK